MKEILDYLAEKREFTHQLPISESKKYIKDPSSAPQGANVQTGPKGGHYYDTGSVPKGSEPEQKPDTKQATSDKPNLITNHMESILEMSSNPSQKAYYASVISHMKPRKIQKLTDDERQRVDDIYKRLGMKPKMKDCFMNAQKLAGESNGDITYVEGFYMFPDLVPLPFDHAWCSINGKDFDPTQLLNGKESQNAIYNGMEISQEEVRRNQVETEMFTSVSRGIFSKEQQERINNLFHPEKIEAAKKTAYGNLSKAMLKKEKADMEKFYRGEDSKGMNTDDDGNYTPERLKLHDEIIKSAFKGVKPSGSPEIIFSAGIPGSGKTHTLRTAEKEGLDGFVTVSADDVKELLPEYDNGDGSTLVHNESKDIMKKIYKIALENKYNMVMDGTLKTYKTALKKVQDAKQHGYKTKMLGVYLPVHEAIKRASERYERSGRYISYKLIEEGARKTFSSVESLKTEVDSYKIYNNDVALGEEPIRLERMNEKMSDIDEAEKFDDEMAKLQGDMDTDWEEMASGVLADYPGNPFKKDDDIEDTVAVNEKMIKKLEAKMDGEARGRELPDENFDPVQLADGIKVELEHTDVIEEAKSIAKDHLAEFDDYYKGLTKMEDELKKLEEEIDSEIKPKNTSGEPIPDGTGPHGRGAGPGEGKGDGTGLLKVKNKMDSEIKQKDNPIQENPENPRNPKKEAPGAEITDKKLPDEEKDLMESLDKEMKKCEAELDKAINNKPKPIEKSIDDYLADSKEFLHQAPKFAESRKYIKDPSEAPEGANVQKGARGGLYYDSDGAGGSAGGDAGQSSDSNQIDSSAVSTILGDIPEETATAFEMSGEQDWNTDYIMAMEEAEARGYVTPKDVDLAIDAHTQLKAFIQENGQDYFESPEEINAAVAGADKVIEDLKVLSGGSQPSGGDSAPKTNFGKDYAQNAQDDAADILDEFKAAAGFGTYDPESEDDLIEFIDGNYPGLDTNTRDQAMQAFDDITKKGKQPSGETDWLQRDLDNEGKYGPMHNTITALEKDPQVNEGIETAVEDISMHVKQAGGSRQEIDNYARNLANDIIEEYDLPANAVSALRLRILGGLEDSGVDSKHPTGNTKTVAQPSGGDSDKNTPSKISAKDSPTMAPYVDGLLKKIGYQPNNARQENPDPGYTEEAAIDIASYIVEGGDPEEIKLQARKHATDIAKKHGLPEESIDSIEQDIYEKAKSVPTPKFDVGTTVMDRWYDNVKVTDMMGYKNGQAVYGLSNGHWAYEDDLSTTNWDLTPAQFKRKTGKNIDG